LKINAVDVDATLGKARQLLAEEEGLSPALISTIEVLLMLVSVLLNRATLNSTNSSKPPSSDPNRKKKKRSKSDKPSGAQQGHVGKTLQKADDPDVIDVIKVDRSTLPEGKYREVGFETRQVFDIDISRIVTEYQAQILENAQGKRFVAPFPEGVTKAVQYGNQIKAHAVYLSQYQLLPYKRIQEYFADQLQMPISEGSLYTSIIRPLHGWPGLSKPAKTILQLRTLAMPMKQASISMASAIGCTVCPMNTGHTIFPIRNGVKRRWMRRAYCPTLTVSSAMTIGSLITAMSLSMPYVMPIISGN